jgi:Mg2+ and Co2+ transporter CorA
LKNYLSTILGQDGVPLNYVIRDEEAPDYELEHEIDCDFEQLAVDCAPLTGTIFGADAKTVHQLIHGFIQGETAEIWTRSNARRKNGRLDFQALQAHFEGEGNKQIRLDEAEQLRRNLMHKNERVLSFDKFLTSMQRMFQGFYDAGEECLEPQKIRVLFEKIQSPALQMAKSSLMVHYDLDVAGTVTYEFIANSLSAQATGQAPDHATNRNTSGVGSQGGALAPEGGVTSTDGTIFTGHYPNWQQLTDANKQSVYDERKRLGIKNTKGKKPPYKGRQASAIKSKKKQVSKLNRKIASLKARLKSANANDDDDDEPEAIQDNAGDQFGGRKKRKENKT